MLFRFALLATACGVAATTAGAAPPAATNGRLAFSRQQGDNVVNPQIFVISANGSQRTRVSRQTAFGGAVWSPDGRRIAYPTEGGVTVVRADGRGREHGFEVGQEPDGADLDWSPDGKRIAVASDRLYVKTLGGRLRALTRRGASSPSWSPDGRRIAYRSFYRIFVIGDRGGKGLPIASSRGTINPPSWSPDGRKLVVGIDGDLYVVDVRTRKRRRIVSKRWSDGPIWSPNGQWVAFTSGRASGRTRDVFLIRPDGSSPRRLTRTPDHEGSLTWSPSGRRLAYSGRRGDVFVVDLTGRDRHRISRTKCGDGADLLTWSPRGDRFAFRSALARRDAEIMTADATGADVRPLTPDCNVWERNPAWSPRGDELAYDRYAGRERHIYIASKDGSDVRRVTRNPGDSTDPSWSANAEQLVFSRFFNGHTELFVINRDGTGERQLTDMSGTTPAWSPRGDRIAFASSRNAGPWQIYVMNPDGSGAIPLTVDGGTQPAWSPDGSRIAFTHDYNIWIINADGTDPRRLTARDGYTEALSPAWSADGTKIAYSEDVDGGRGSQYALYVVDANDGTPLSVIFDNQDNLDPDWQRIP